MSHPFIKVLFSLSSVLFFVACQSKPQAKKITDDLSVGQTFEIRIGENQSTGYEICWINKQEAHAISLVKKEYKISNSNCIGCAGTAVFTFKAIAAGKDTIKLASCPTLREGKNCDDVSKNGITEVENYVAVIR